MWHRRRGTAIVETKKGILVVAGYGKLFMLPGGAAKRKESRLQAAIRELQEETGLVAKFVSVLFNYKGNVHRSCTGGHYQDHHTVIYIEAEGIPHPNHEIKHIAFYTSESDIKISRTTKKIIEKYYQSKKNQV